MAMNKNNNVETVAPLFGVEVDTIQETEYFDVTDYEKFTINDAEAGTTFKGKPNVFRFEPKEGRKSTSVRIRLIDDEEKELLDAYMNVPLDFPMIKNIRQGFDFYRSTFDCITSVLEKINPNIVKDARGNRINRINKINLEEVIEYLNNKETLTIEVLEGAEDSEYNSFRIIDWE